MFSILPENVWLMFYVVDKAHVCVHNDFDHWVNLIDQNFDFLPKKTKGAFLDNTRTHTHDRVIVSVWAGAKEKAKASTIDMTLQRQQRRLTNCGYAKNCRFSLSALNECALSLLLTHTRSARLCDCVSSLDFTMRS